MQKKSASSSLPVRYDFSMETREHVKIQAKGLYDSCKRLPAYKVLENLYKDYKLELAKAPGKITDEGKISLDRGRAQLRELINDASTARHVSPAVRDELTKLLSKDFPEFSPSGNFKGTIRDAKEYLDAHWMPVGIAGGLAAATGIFLHERRKRRKIKQEQETQKAIQQQRALIQQRLSGVPGGVFKPGMQPRPVAIPQQQTQKASFSNLSASAVHWNSNITDILTMEGGNGLTLRQQLSMMGNAPQEDYYSLYTQSRKAIENNYADGRLDHVSYHKKIDELNNAFKGHIRWEHMRKLGDLISAHPFISITAALASIGIIYKVTQQIIRKRKAKQQREADMMRYQQQLATQQLIPAQTMLQLPQG